MGIITSLLNHYMTSANDPDLVTGLTSREKYLIKSSWIPLRGDLTGSGVALLLLFFKKFPKEQQHFPFRDIKDEDLAASKKFQAHCTSVMYAVDSIMDSFHDSELLVNILQKTGKNHKRNGITLESFWKLKETMLELFGQSMSKETIDAWDKTLQVIFGVIGKELDNK